LVKKTNKAFSDPDNLLPGGGGGGGEKLSRFDLGMSSK